METFTKILVGFSEIFYIVAPILALYFGFGTIAYVNVDPNQISVFYPFRIWGRFRSYNISQIDKIVFFYGTNQGLRIFKKDGSMKQHSFYAFGDRIIKKLKPLSEKGIRLYEMSLVKGCELPIK